MKYIDEPMIKYFNDAASGNETPGGGSISGVCGALSASMMSMACNFTVGKKKYEEYQDEIKENLNAAMEIMDDMLKQSVADTEGFKEVAAAYSMPAENQEQKKARSEAIQSGCKTALKAPEKIFDNGFALIRKLRRLVDICNKNLISDIGVSAVCAFAAMESAYINVKINLKFIKDDEYCKEKSLKIEKAVQEAENIVKEIKTKVIQYIS